MGRTRREQQPFSIAPERILKALSPDEVAAAVERWMACFGRHSAGIRADEFIWHVFSAERFPSLRLDMALGEYAKQESCEYVVERLNAENMARIRKAAEAEAARRKGWA